MYPPTSCFFLKINVPWFILSVHGNGPQQRYYMTLAFSIYHSSYLVFLVFSFSLIYVCLVAFAHIFSLVFHVLRSLTPFFFIFSVIYFRLIYFFSFLFNIHPFIHFCMVVVGVFLIFFFPFPFSSFPASSLSFLCHFLCDIPFNLWGFVSYFYFLIYHCLFTFAWREYS